jgi:hypothetical protein
MRQWLSVLLVLGSTACWALDEIVGDLSDDTSVIQVRVLPISKFNRADIKELAGRFLGSASKGRNLAVLSMFADRNVAALETGVSCESGYPQWRAYYHNPPKDALAAADVISIGKDAVVRLRTPDGTIVRDVIRGTDPTQFSVDGATFEILQVSGRVRSRFEGCGVPGSIDPVIYLKTSSNLTEELCQRATSLLTVRLDKKQIWTHFRNDHWFLCGQFPIWYPYSAPAQPPSEKAYYALPDFSCSVSCDDVPRCLGSALRPPVSRKGYR